MRTACPAATPINETSVLCGVLALANEDAEIRGFTHRASVSPVIDGRRDRSVRLFCCGDGSLSPLACYTECPIWRAQREAEWAARAELRDAAHREYVDVDELGARMRGEA